jgi:hypothetical protein
MNDETGTLSWSTESIGYESQGGDEGVQISYDVVPDSNTAYYIPAVCTTPDAGEVVFSVIHVQDHVGPFVVGEPMTVTFTDAQSCNEGDSE